jgi:hypothetical protein
MNFDNAYCNYKKNVQVREDKDDWNYVVSKAG